MRPRLDCETCCHYENAPESTEKEIVTKNCLKGIGCCRFTGIMMITLGLRLVSDLAFAESLTIAPTGPGQFTLWYSSASNRPWRVQASADLANWLYAPMATMGNGSLQSATATTTGERGFWRIVEFPPDTGYKPTAGPFAVAPSSDESWFDTARGYTMPVRIYAPATGQEGAPYATLILSHGLSGAVGAFDALCGYLTSHGFICVMIQHDDTRILSRIERPKDVTFALDYLLGSPTNSLLAGRVDASRLAHIGHSFGAFTALAVLGARFHQTDENSPIVNLPDMRLKCGIAMSPQGEGVLGLFSGSWDLITRPALTMHGTADTDPFVTNSAMRRQPYDEMPAGDKGLIALADAVHNSFTDTGIATQGDTYTRWYFPAIAAFLDAHLNSNATGAAWLDALSVTRLSSGVATLETK